MLHQGGAKNCIEAAAQAASSSAKLAERRGSLRKAVGVPALIMAPGLSIPLSCIVCDISQTGARIYLHEATDNAVGARAKVPTSFTVVMRADRLEADCQIVWRQGGVIGVRFTSLPKPMSRRAA